ncbi:MAG: HDIG domain-containing metalloprotein [Planctomycetota bacterium]
MALSAKRIKSGVIERIRGGGGPGRWVRFVEAGGIRRSILGLVFVLVLVLLLSWGDAPPDIRAGDTARRDHRARVAFSCNDLRQLQNDQSDARVAAERFVPNAYDEDLRPLDLLEDRFRNLLDRVPATARLGEIPAAVRRDWPEIGVKEYELIRTVVTREDLPAVLARIHEALEVLRRTGVMDPRRYEEEDSNRYIADIVVRSAPPRQIPVHQTVMAEPARIREALAVSSLFRGMPDRFRDLISALLVPRIPPTLRYNEAESRAARARSVLSVTVRPKMVRVGEVLLRHGERADAIAAYELREEALSWRRAQPMARRIARVSGVVFLVTVFSILFFVNLSQWERRKEIALGRVVGLGAFILAMVAFAKVFFLLEWSHYLYPLPLAAMLMTMFYSQRMAVTVSFVIALFLGIQANLDFTLPIVLFAGSMAAAYGAGTLRRRSTLMKIGGLTGLVQAVVRMGIGLLAPDTALAFAPGETLPPWLEDTLWAGLNGLGTGFVLSGGLPFLENLFNLSTDIRLLELSDQNHPLLKRMVLEAPGTYHHSILVGNLAESAAEAIGADTLVCRVSAYYHDIGKLMKPEYFAENIFPGENPHRNLSPTMSTLIICAHPRDGLALAEQHRLPMTLREVIAAHHGTSVIEYFYLDALRRAGTAITPDVEAFRYPGPRPRSRECGVVMLADSVEAATRALSDPTSARIEELVREIVRKRMEDRQLDECPLTLRELDLVSQSLVRVLVGIYHARVRYPGSPDPGDGAESRSGSAVRAVPDAPAVRE